MAENIENIEQQEQITPAEAAIQMMRNMVPKEQFDEVNRQYAQLIQNLSKGQMPEIEPAPVIDQETRDRRFRELVTKMADTDHSMGPVEAFKNMLEVDQYLRDCGQRSLFAPSSGELDSAAQLSCDRVRDLISAAVDNSDGSDAVCVAYLGNHLVDPLMGRPVR